MNEYQKAEQIRQQMIAADERGDKAEWKRLNGERLQALARWAATATTAAPAFDLQPPRVRLPRTPGTRRERLAAAEGLVAADANSFAGIIRRRRRSFERRW